jgi:flagellar biosynthesis/type III secretory pathway chaperone
MIDDLNKLIESLREELKQYGELLARLDHQQEVILAMASDDIIATVSAVNDQSAIVAQARKHRENCRINFARKIGKPDKTTFEELIPLMPEEYRPLVKALVEENNKLIIQVQQRARQNHLLLKRSLELMQQFINSLIRPETTTVYNGAGTLKSEEIKNKPLYEAIG